MYALAHCGQLCSADAERLYILYMRVNSSTHANMHSLTPILAPHAHCADQRHSTYTLVAQFANHIVAQWSQQPRLSTTGDEVAS